MACSRTAKPEGWAAPAADETTVLVPHRDKLFAYEAESFQPQWIFPGAEDDDTDTSALYGNPDIDQGVVYLPTYSDRLYALELATGRPVWTAPFRAGDSLVGGALAANGFVYIGSSDGSVHAVDAETGLEDWSFKTGDEVWSTPILDGTTLYVTSLDGKLYALDAATGESLWSFETAAGIAATPALSDADGLVYVGGFDSRLRAIDTETHEERWVGAADNWFWATPLVQDGAVYAASLDHRVYAFHSDTGESLWDSPFKADAEVRAAPIIAGDVLIIADRDGHIHALDPQTGSETSTSLNLGSGVDADPLVLSNGQVLIVTTNGTMVRINPETMEIVSQNELNG